jgi:hypothetical protein
MSEGARSFDCTRCKGVDVACVARVGQGGGLCVAQLAAHGTGQVGVGRLPALDAIRVGPFRVEEYRVAQLGHGIVAAAAEQLRDAVHIGMADIGQGHGQGIGFSDDHRLGGRMDHALAEHRPLLGCAAHRAAIDAGSNRSAEPAGP